MDILGTAHGKHTLTLARNEGARPIVAEIAPRGVDDLGLIVCARLVKVGENAVGNGVVEFGVRHFLYSFRVFCLPSSLMCFYYSTFTFALQEVF